MTKHPITTEKTGTRTRAARIAIAAIACIPLIYGGSLIWANQDPTHRLDKVPAAVVDLDQPVSYQGTSYDVGKQVEHDLTTNRQNDDFDWTATSAANASAGLKNGTYLAEIVLPKNMSSNAVSLGGNADDAAASQIRITTNDGQNFIVGIAAKTIGLTVAQNASTGVAQQYLAQIYSGLDQISGQLTDAANGAKQLAAGAGTLTSGTSQLAAGAGHAASGAAQLASGLGSAQSGADQLASGSSQVAAGTSQLASKTAQAASGAQQLATGASKVAAGTAENEKQIKAAAAGASEVAAGDQELANDAAELNSAVQALSALGISPTQIQDLVNQLPTTAQQYVDGVNQLASMCAGLASSGNTDVSQLCAQVNKVAGNSGELSSAAQQLASAAPTLSNIVTQATNSTQTLATETQKLSTGANTLASGLKSGAGQAAELNSGAQQLASGANTLATGLQTGASGASTLNSGAQQLASGANTLAAKLGGATSGAAQLAAGNAKLASGADELTSGAGELASGSGTLATRLASGAASVPNYTAAQQDKLSNLAAQPVALDQTKLNAVPSYGYGLSPYFLALGAWVGGLSIYMILRAIPLRAIERGRPAWAAALLGYLRGVWISLAQTALLYLIVTIPIGVHPENPAGLAAFMALTGLAFTAVNHALMTLFGSRGRFLGLILLVLQVAAAGATYPVQTTPAFFQVIHGLLPLTYAANAIRSLIAGGGAGVAQGVIVLSCWLLVSLAISVAVTVARRARRAEIMIPDFVV